MQFAFATLQPQDREERLETVSRDQSQREADELPIPVRLTATQGKETSELQERLGSRGQVPASVARLASCDQISDDACLHDATGWTEGRRETSRLTFQETREEEEGGTGTSVFVVVGRR